MVKDLRGILSMISLDVYQITNHSSYLREHVICLIFERLGFFMNTKVWFVWSQVLFNSKSDYLKCQCCGSTGSEGGKMFIWTKFFLTLIRNFQVWDNWKVFVYFMFEKFLEFKIQCTNVWSTSLFISCTHSCKDSFVFKKCTQRWNY